MSVVMIIAQDWRHLPHIFFFWGYESAHGDWFTLPRDM